MFWRVLKSWPKKKLPITSTAIIGIDEKTSKVPMRKLGVQLSSERGRESTLMFRYQQNCSYNWWPQGHSSCRSPPFLLSRWPRETRKFIQITVCSQLYLTRVQLKRIPDTSNFYTMHCGSPKPMFKGLAKASLKSKEIHTTLEKPRSWWAEMNDWNHEQFTYIIPSDCWKNSTRYEASQECKTISSLITFSVVFLTQVIWTDFILPLQFPFRPAPFSFSNRQVSISGPSSRMIVALLPSSTDRMT